MKSWPAVLIGATWALHFAHWIWMTIVKRGPIAHRGEWLRELTLRLVILLLVIWSLITPEPDVGHYAAAAGVALAFAGTMLAILGRRTLGEAWGIGVLPHGNAKVTGVYSVIRHPVYTGTVTALIGQWLALSNTASAVLLAGALIVIPLKVYRESSLLAEK